STHVTTILIYTRSLHDALPISISSWTLGDKCTFEQRCKAAAEAGYDGIGLRAETYVDALNEGLTDKDIIDILNKYNITCTEVERSEEHTSELQSRFDLVCRLLL